MYSQPPQQLQGLYTLSPSSTPSPSANTRPPSSAASTNASNLDATILQTIGRVQNAIESTDLTVLRNALRDAQYLISDLHHEIKNVRTKWAEAEARLVNIAAKSKSSVRNTLAEEGKLSAETIATADNLKLFALKWSTVWIVRHSLYYPDYLFGNPPPVGWGEYSMSRVERRYASEENRKAGNILELYDATPQSLHCYLLTAQDFKPLFRKAASQARSTVARYCVTASSSILSDFASLINHSLEDVKRTTGAALKSQIGDEPPQEVAFGPSLFNRNCDIRNKVPALLTLNGYANGMYRRWAPFLYKDFNAPEEAYRGVPFSAPCLLLAASVMIYGPTAPEQKKLTLRGSNQLHGLPDLKTTPGLIANAAGLVRYLLSADNALTSDGLGAITSIAYSKDVEEYKAYLEKKWEDHEIQAIVKKWDRRLFPSSAAARGHEMEDLTTALESARIDESADAMIARAAPPAVTVAEPMAEASPDWEFPPEPEPAYGLGAGSYGVDAMLAAEPELEYAEPVRDHHRPSYGSGSRWNDSEVNEDYREEFMSEPEDDVYPRRVQVREGFDYHPNVPGTPPVPFGSTPQASVVVPAAPSVPSQPTQTAVQGQTAIAMPGSQPSTTPNMQHPPNRVPTIVRDNVHPAPPALHQAPGPRLPSRRLRSSATPVPEDTPAANADPVLPARHAARKTRTRGARAS